MKSLVTGATGFIGGHLVEALVAAGDHVRVLIRPLSETQHLVDLPVERCIGDLTDPRSLNQVVEGVDRIFHCAAVVSDWGDPDVFQAVNVNGTQYLLSAAFDAAVGKFVHVSSTEVYGHPGYPATERAPYRYRGWPYCDTKIDAEKWAWAFSRKGLPLTIVRPATVYGPRSATVVELIERLRTNQMVLVGGGRENAGLLYVRNLCDFMLLVGQPEVGVGQVYNLTDGNDVTWERFINTLAAMLSLDPVRRSFPRRLTYLAGWTLESWYDITHQRGRPPVSRMAVEFIGTDQGFPNDRARRELGWHPRVDFETGMERVRAWLQQQGYLGR